MGRAAVALCLVATLDALHIVVALLIAPAERRTSGFVVGTVLVNAALVILLIWLAASVRRGRRTGAAIGISAVFGTLSCVIFGTVFATAYSAPWWFGVVQVTLTLAWWWALVALLAARRESGRRRALGAAE